MPALREGCLRFSRHSLGAHPIPLACAVQDLNVNGCQLVTDACALSFSTHGRPSSLKRVCISRSPPSPLGRFGSQPTVIRPRSRARPPASFPLTHSRLCRHSLAQANPHHTGAWNSDVHACTRTKNESVLPQRKWRVVAREAQRRPAHNANGCISQLACRSSAAECLPYVAVLSTLSTLDPREPASRLFPVRLQLVHTAVKYARLWRGAGLASGRTRCSVSVTREGRLWVSSVVCHVSCSMVHGAALGLLSEVDVSGCTEITADSVLQLALSCPQVQPRIVPPPSRPIPSRPVPSRPLPSPSLII
jgi:hypothetical protein